MKLCHKHKVPLVFLFLPLIRILPVRRTRLVVLAGIAVSFFEVFKTHRLGFPVANAHRDKPPIIEATDSKWWGWKEALEECGITVEFLCPDEIEEVYRRKMG